MTIFHYLMFGSLLITLVLTVLRFIGMELDFLDMFDDSDTVFGIFSVDSLSWAIFGYSFTHLALMGTISSAFMLSVVSFFSMSLLLWFKVWIFKKIFNFLDQESNLIKPDELVGLKARTITKVDSNGHGTVHIVVREKMTEYMAVSDELIPSGENVIITEVFGSKLKVRKI